MAQDPYLAQIARIKDAFLTAVNSDQPPSIVAESALRASFPAATLTNEDNVITSRQGFGVQERTYLEDALHEMPFELTGMSVDASQPMLSWRHPHAQQVSACAASAAAASHKAQSSPVPEAQRQSTIVRFLDITQALTALTVSEPFGAAERLKRIFDYDSWARVLEGLMELGTTADCSDLFHYMEGCMAVFCSDTFMRDMTPKLTLLRTCNMLARRLSKALDMQLCGRLLIFLARVYALNDKAGVNMQGIINSLPLPLDDVQPGALDSIGEPIDKKLYTTFWSLQQIFQSPSQVFQPAVYTKVAADISTVLEEFKTIKHPVAAVGMFSGGRGHEMELTSTNAMEVDISASSSASSSNRPMGQELTVRYLTSSKLFGLQLRDCTFRRHFILQCLMLTHYYDNPNKQDKPPAVRPDSLDALNESLYKALSDTKDGGKEFAGAVRMVLGHETHWVAWKKDMCKDFSKTAALPLADVIAQSQPELPAGKRRRVAARAAEAKARDKYAVASLVRLQDDPLAGLAARDRLGPPAPFYPDQPSEQWKRQQQLPQIREFFDRIVFDMDPDNDIEAEYRAVKQDKLYAWKATRMIARRDLEVYIRAGADLERAAQELFPDVKEKMEEIAKAKAAAEAAQRAEEEAQGDAASMLQEGNGAAGLKQEQEGDETLQGANGDGGGGELEEGQAEVDAKMEEADENQPLGPPGA